uniref:RING-type domain-containing protein n=1 Tax=Haplochromis burtoni TaxID=8153 RepID=A0A3Q2V1X8_HAPBU
MASASSLLCEEQFLCSICLNTFTDPVTTPCGHNYCKTCITEYWDSSDVTQCPLCKKRFRRRPQLQPHLEPHQRVASLKKHKLIDPISNLKGRVCQKHDKMLELFCCTDQVCICFMCLKDDHVTHVTIPSERAFREGKARLESLTSEMKAMEKTKSSHVKEAKRSARQNKDESEREVADIAVVLGALVASLLKNQDELIKLIQEKHKAVETQAETHIALLEEEVDELRRGIAELEEFLQTEDHLHFLHNEDNLMGNLQTYCMHAVFQSFTHQAASSRSAINLKYNLRASH